MDVDMRASDEDRQRVVAALQRHTAAGRLTLEEFSDRVGHVYAARTLAELATAIRDLPAEPPPAPAHDADGARHLVIAFAVAAGVLVLLGAFLALF
jgi:hypothetical protein